MSFVPEVNETKFSADYIPNITSLPYNYLPQTRNLNNEVPLVNTWYQPGDKGNEAILNMFNISSNQQYRKYMTKNSQEIIVMNQKEYKKQSIK
jgi:hypothetical protein